MADPKLVALLLCDTATRDFETQKISLIGLIGALIAPRLPTGIRAALYFQCTDIVDKMPFKVDIVQVDQKGNERTMGESTGEFDLKGSLKELDFFEAIVQIPVLPVFEYGHIAFRLTVDGRLLGEKRLSIFEEPPQAQSASVKR